MFRTPIIFFRTDCDVAREKEKKIFCVVVVTGDKVYVGIDRFEKRFLLSRSSLPVIFYRSKVRKKTIWTIQAQ